MANSAGTVVPNESYSYDAYGVLLGGPRSTQTNLLYTGEMWDAKAQMYYLRARYYDPLNGRFNQTDPFPGSPQDPQSLHKYLYTHDNPINAIDPTGNFEFGLAGMVQSMAIQAVMMNIVAPVVAPIANEVAYRILPEQVIKAIKYAEPTAALVGGGISGGLAKGIGMGAGFTGEVVFSPKGIAGYINTGGGLQFGGGVNATVSGYGGIVFGADNSQDYRGPYSSLSFGYGHLPPAIKNRLVTVLTWAAARNIGAHDLTNYEMFKLPERLNQLRNVINTKLSNKTTVTFQWWPWNPKVVAVNIGYEYTLGRGLASEVTLSAGYTWQVLPWGDRVVCFK